MMDNNEKKSIILAKIAEYDTIIISRHKRPDGDAVGSTLGLAEMIRATYPGKRVFLDNGDHAEYLAFLNDETEHPADIDYEGALVIAIDTATVDRLSNPRAKLGKELVKIDHHIDVDPYGDFAWIEEERSSACEMVTEFALPGNNSLKLTKRAAECLYTGMVTDSGRFKYRGTAPSTMRCAALLLEQGINTERIYAHLYMDDLSTVRYHGEAAKNIKITENGVAWLRITRSFREKHGLSLENASNVVSVMDSIKGSLIWIAFIDNDDGSTRVRLRSRFVEVEKIAEKYHGGGHACACGATVYSLKELRALLKDADELLKAYKSEHEDLI